MNRLEIAANESGIDRLTGPRSDTLVACTPLLAIAGFVAGAGAGFNIAHAFVKGHIEPSGPVALTAPEPSGLSVDQLIAYLPA